MKKQKRFFAASLAMIMAVMAAVGFTLFSLAGTVERLSVEMGRSEADAILASAEISEETVATVPILYYDQVQDPCVNIYDGDASGRQFEWAECGYYGSAYEAELSEAKLGEDYLPVAQAGDLLPNRGLDFSRWFSVVEGESKSYMGKLALSYDAAEASFSYESEEFYPLDGISKGFSGEEFKGGEHNKLFTFNLGVPISVLRDGREEFSIAADDDTFVFIGEDLVLDLGGVHGEMTGRFRITEEGEVYTAVGAEDFGYSGVRLEEGAAVVRIFHADRNSTESIFKLKFSNMLLNITDTVLAGTDEVQVAYDPENPSFIAPLGESLTVKPNLSRAILISAVIQISLLGVLMIVFLLTISLVSRYSRRSHIREE
ncbi:MAG: hypothetical protein Q4B65_00165 [Candidatus Saccharibacteria bacterium]|nr:hypothetical protein [Candidatus Saccharibacteria bacterium]